MFILRLIYLSNNEHMISNSKDKCLIYILNSFKKLWKNNWNGKRFLHISTDEVYGTLGENGFFKETTSYCPNSPYSASKAGSDHFVRAYGETYKMPYIITNCSNNYGQNQFPLWKIKKN